MNEEKLHFDHINLFFLLHYHAFRLQNLPTTVFLATSKIMHELRVTGCPSVRYLSICGSRLLLDTWRGLPDGRLIARIHVLRIHYLIQLTGNVCAPCTNRVQVERLN